MLICLDSIRIPIAIGRSNKVPIFLISAGAKFIIILPSGNSNPEFIIAALTLSFASRTDASASPTIAKLGKPFVISTSTFIRQLFIPI